MCNLNVDLLDIEAPLIIEREIKLNAKTMLTRVPCRIVLDLGIRKNGRIAVCSKYLDLGADNFAPRGANAHRALLDAFCDEAKKQILKGVEVAQFEICLFPLNDSYEVRDLFSIKHKGE